MLRSMFFLDFAKLLLRSRLCLCKNLCREKIIINFACHLFMKSCIIPKCFPAVEGWKVSSNLDFFAHLIISYSYVC